MMEHIAPGAGPAPLILIKDSVIAGGNLTAYSARNDGKGGNHNQRYVGLKLGYRRGFKGSREVVTPSM